MMDVNMDRCNDIEGQIMEDEGCVYWNLMMANTLRVSLTKTRPIKRGERRQARGCG